MKLEDFKKTPVVFCSPEIRFVDYDEVTGRFLGPAEKILNQKFDIVKSLFNATLKMSKEHGDLQNSASGALPGCFGLLQQGKADINMYPFEMPLVDIENVTQINVSAIQSGTYMLSPYSMNESLGAVAFGPLHSFRSVSPEIWSIIGVTFVTFTYMMLLVGHLSRVTRRTEGGLRGQSALYQVATHLIQHESCDFSGDSARFISLLMSLFAFFFITLFASMMASERASVNTFQIYDSYEKILSNPNVQPVWFKSFDDYKQYKRSPVGSPRHNLWTQSLAISGGDKSRPAVISADEVEANSLQQLAKKKETVFFVTNLFAKLFNGILCNVYCSTAEGFDSTKDLRLKGTLDTEATPSLYVLPVSRHSPPAVARGMELVMRRGIESALMNQPDLAIAIEQYTIKEYMRATIIYNEDYFKCVDFEKLPIDDPETVPLFLTAARELFIWWAVGCAISFVVFLIENIYHQLNHVR